MNAALAQLQDAIIEALMEELLAAEDERREQELKPEAVSEAAE